MSLKGKQPQTKFDTKMQVKKYLSSKEVDVWLQLWLENSPVSYSSLSSLEKEIQIKGLAKQLSISNQNNPI